MRELDSLLRRVTRPARYTGGEWNSITKDWSSIDIKVALSYPDLYDIGMSNLGIAIIYDIINAQPYALAERVFAPWVDMEAELRKSSTPLFSLESRRPLADFDIIGFSLGYELTYTNVLNMLDLAGIPVMSTDRNDSHPLVIAGGSCSLNPEPISDFIDLFVLGDGEEVIVDLLSIVRDWKSSGADSREHLLRKLSKVDGIYVPAFYRIDYRDDNIVAHVSPASADISPLVRRRISDPLPPALTRPVVPYVSTIHDRAAIEIQRGCTRGCRFCQAGVIYRPVRERPVNDVISAIDELLRNTGYSELSLLSLSTSDYSEIESLVSAILARFQEERLNLSLPSLRIDSHSLSLIDSITFGKKAGLTFAPEAGTERLRQSINKGLSEDEMYRTLSAAAEHGWNSAKLYFIIGLPGEKQADIDGILYLARQFRQANRGKEGKRLNFKINASPFVPKAHTPFQWAAQSSVSELGDKIDYLRCGLKRSGIRLSWQDPRMSLLEAVMARGDRRLSQVIYQVWQKGATFDAWSERFDLERWIKAFDECGIDPAFYASRQRAMDEVFPWSHIDVGVNIEYLRQEYFNSIKETATEDCRFGRCNVCGLESWHSACQSAFYSSSSSSA